MSLDCRVYAGLCPDESCQTKLYFSASKTIIECHNCGQTHKNRQLRDVFEVTNTKEAFLQIVKSMCNSCGPKKGSDSIKVHGLSNYHCKLLSPWFTRYGMNNEGKAQLLQELGHGETADCGRLLGDRSFLIAPEHIEITGYGRDQSGSAHYLKGVLEIIKSSHDGEERLIPIHADGDGHCLVHALSRAMTGREIFWHALRDNLVNHLEKNLNRYKMLFKEFIHEDEWSIIISEANPYNTAQDEFNAGLRNIHIFALANVLRRPIVLLDSLEGIKNVADYTAIFVPVMVEPSECAGNVPLCIAWSGSGHNHFIPLVGVADLPTPTIPQALIPNIWGVDKTCAMQYLNYNDDRSLTVGGGNPLPRGYVQRLISALEDIFLQHQHVSAKLVSDMHLSVFKRDGFVGLHPDIATKKTRDAFKEGMIFRCLMCDALTLSGSVKEGRDGSPGSGVVNTFDVDKFWCEDDQYKKCSVPYRSSCMWCGAEKLRKVDRIGNFIYENGDPTNTAAELPGSWCGNKHFWDGKEYEQVPKVFSLIITLKGKDINEMVTWFYDDSKPSYNSVGSTVAMEITRKYFEKDFPEFEEVHQKILNALYAMLEEYDQAHAQYSHDMTTALCDIKNHNVPCDQASSSSRCYPASSSHVHATKPKKKALSAPKKSTAQLEPLVPVTPRRSASRKNENRLSSLDDREFIRIRISSSDGRQCTPTVDKTLDYSQLQSIVETSFDISPSRQVLKMGFPPKVLVTKGKDVAIGLRNGDRVVVEYHQQVQEENTKSMVESQQETVNVKEKTFINTMKTLRDIQLSETISKLSAEAVDAALEAVSNMAKVTGRSEWEYALHHPELFRPGGAFYEQFRLDVGLIAGQHCALPLLPGKTFYYNETTDEIELCNEPLGHHPIGPEISFFPLASHQVGGCCTRSQNQISSDGSDKENFPLGIKTWDSGSKKSARDEGATDCEVTCAQDNNQQETIKLAGTSQSIDSVDESDNIERGNEETPGVASLVEKAVVRLSKRQKEVCEKTIVKIPKLAPSFTIVGEKPAMISPEEAERKRKELIKVLSSKKKKTDTES